MRLLVWCSQAQALAIKSSNSLELVVPAIEQFLCLFSLRCLLPLPFFVPVLLRIGVDLLFLLRIAVAGIELTRLTSTRVGGKSLVGVGRVKKRIVTQHVAAHVIGPLHHLWSQV